MLRNTFLLASAFVGFSAAEYCDDFFPENPEIKDCKNILGPNINPFEDNNSDDSSNDDD